MHERIVIISDTHFGRRRACARSAESLLPLWEGATRFIINGDVAEVHHPTHWNQAAREVLHLFDLCERDDVPLTLLSGNHDPFLTDHRHLLLADGSILVTHGDAIHPAVAPWSPAAGRIRAAFDHAMSSVEPEKRSDLQTRLTVSQHAAHAEWGDLAHEAKRSTIWGMLIRPWAIARVLWYWWAFPSMAARFVEEHAPDARYIIIGHTHHPGVWRVGERTIINTGSFGFPGRPRAVIVEEDQLSVWPITFRSGRYVYGPRAIARFMLEEIEKYTTEDLSQPFARG